MRRFDEPIERWDGHEHYTAYCSRCQRRPAHWLVKKCYHQRYYCDECVKITRAWKEQKTKHE